MKHKRLGLKPCFRWSYSATALICTDCEGQSRPVERLDKLGYYRYL